MPDAPDCSSPEAGGEAPRRTPSPAVAAVLSALLPGAGQIYNRQLEKAVLIWIWGVLLGVVGIALLLLGMLARALPVTATPPPLGDWVVRHGGVATVLWIGGAAALWIAGIRDARESARGIRSGEITIRYSLRRQLAHVLSSQLLGFVPFIGLFFPPGVVAEAMDAARDRRRPRAKTLVRESARGVVEWAVTRVSFYLVWLLLGVWFLWWVLRAMRLAP